MFSPEQCLHLTTQNVAGVGPAPVTGEPRHWLVRSKGLAIVKAARQEARKASHWYTFALLYVSLVSIIFRVSDSDWNSKYLLSTLSDVAYEDNTPHQ